MQRDRDFLITVARRYYINEKSQQQIAEEFGISRPTVSNLLKKCKELGVVQIKIENGYPYATEVGDRLAERYGLEQAVITARSPEGSLMSSVGVVAAEYTSSLLKEHIKIGIAWGSSLYHMVHQLISEPIGDSIVVQLMGGFGASSPQYDGADLAREFSKRISARYYPLNCPVLVQNETVKELLLKEHGIQSTIEKTRTLDLAFVGISSNDPNQSAMVRAGFVSEQEAGEIQQAGAVGHVCGYSYDKDGKLLDISYNRRIIGIEFNDFLSIKKRVGIAYGPQKVQAIRASLIGGHLTTLITDEVTAMQLLA